MPVTGVLYALVFLLATALIVFWAIRCRHEDDIWAIGIYRGDDLRSLIPHPGTKGQPALTAADVTDANAQFVADPFLVRTDAGWFMFLEVLNTVSKHGEIAYASSKDGLKWQYQRIVLKEPFHLSYPQVFEFDGSYYMIPESGQAGSVRLYRATRFPEEWSYIATLLHGDYLDPSMLRQQDRWWLFAMREGMHLSLHTATQLEGPWVEHPMSPIAFDPQLNRPAGRIVAVDQQLVRFSQDGTRTYGYRVFASAIMVLTPSQYAERMWCSEPVLCATGSGWNAHGMHHIDLQHGPDGTWLAAVDGKYIQKHFIWRKGARAIINLFK